MKNNLKIDRPFLSKFNEDSIFINSQNELSLSVIDEIGNILSSKLKLSNEYINLKNVPFSYGIRDLQSIGTSSEELKDFKIHCEMAILELEPRLNDIEISEIKINKEKQTIKIQATCYLKKFNKKLETEFDITT